MHGIESRTTHSKLLEIVNFILLYKMFLAKMLVQNVKEKIRSPGPLSVCFNFYYN